MALRREGSAVQFAAVKLVEKTGEARYELAGDMIELCERVSQACTACPREEAALVGEIWASCQQVIFLCQDWREWFEQTLELPLEACVPEPNLFPAAEVPVPRMGSVPPFTARVRGSIQALQELISMPVFYTSPRTFLANLAM